MIAATKRDQRRRRRRRRQKKKATKTRKICIKRSLPA
jgi:hypothetical protein